MNPVSTQRFRRATGLIGAMWAFLAIVVSFYALIAPRSEMVLPFDYSLVGGVALVHWVAPSAAQAGIEPGDRVVEVDGVSLFRLIQRGTTFLSATIPNQYWIQKRDGTALQVALAPAEPYVSRRPSQILLQLGLLLSSLVYLGIGIAVWVSKSDRAEAWAFMLFCSLMAAQLATTARVDLIPWGAPRLVANLPWLGAATFHLFTVYPIEPRWVVRHRRIRTLPYVGAILISVLAVLEYAMGQPSRWVTDLAYFYGFGFSVTSIGILAQERRYARDAGIGDRADIMLLASVISYLPLVLILMAQYFLRTPFPWYVALLWVVVFPITVGSGMMRKQLFEFRNVAKSSAAYGAASFAITGVFAFIITLADSVLPPFGVNVRSIQVGFLFLAILAFDPLRNRMQGLVNQLFDRDRARYREAVREISEAMVSMLSLREIGDRILVALTETMGVGRAMVLLFDETDRMLRPSALRGDWDDQHIELEIPSEHSIWKHLWMRREELSRADFDHEADPEKREACWDVFDTLEIELLVPILFGVDLLGVIAVGRKMSGERLAPEDRQLLRTLANQSSIAIENAKAFDEIAKLNETLEARVEERTRELRETQDQLMQAEKLKSLGQLVAGVAHELNNPIGFVHANLQLLDEYIKKLVDGQSSESETERIREAIDKLLVRSREGTERVKQIVMDLRTFSRMDQADLQRADLHEEIDRTLALMAPRFKGGIDVERHYGDIPQVRCYPGQLNQVFMNLLMNACDELGSEGTITITSELSELGVRLSFHDNGSGISPEVQGRLFDPFFTTKPVGQGTGLGLSLSHGIIERHGGRIWADSAGDGTTFLIDLPLDAAPADE